MSCTCTSNPSHNTYISIPTTLITQLYNTAKLLPLHVKRGVSVLTSQNLTVVSPEPLARCLQWHNTTPLNSHVRHLSIAAIHTRKKVYSYLPSGLNCDEITASVCPFSELVHRVTALTRNMARGWYTISNKCSVVSRSARPRVASRVPTISFSLAKNAYGVLSSYKHRKVNNRKVNTLSICMYKVIIDAWNKTLVLHEHLVPVAELHCTQVEVYQHWYQLVIQTDYQQVLQLPS